MVVWIKRISIICKFFSSSPKETLSNLNWDVLICALRHYGRSNGPNNFLGTVIKCRNNELSRFSFLKITKETTMHIKAYTLIHLPDKSNSTTTTYYQNILYSRQQKQKNLGLHRYLTDWKLNSSKNTIRVSRDQWTGRTYQTYYPF